MMKVRTREHAPKKYSGKSQKISLVKPSINPMFLALCVILIPLIMGISIINPLFGLGCILICCIIFPFINKKPLSIQYKTLPSVEATGNVLHHNKFYNLRFYYTELFRKNLFHKEYQSIFITSIMKILLYSFLISNVFIVFIVISFGDSGKISNLGMLYIILAIVGLCLLWGFFHIHKKYKSLKNRIYSPNNNFFFITSPREKYYYEVLENENGGNDYIIY